MPRECWAKCLGNCDTKMTQEHYVSKSYFSSRTVMVRGLPNCRDEAIELPLAGLSRGMLCRTHNSMLGEHVDQIAAATLTMLENTLTESKNAAGFKKRHYLLLKHEFNGLLLERWLLKTLINLSFARGSGIGQGAIRPGWPTDLLVRAAFGEEQLCGDAGLYFEAEVGQTHTLEQRLHFTPVHDRLDGENIVAGRFTFCGMPFVLDLRPLAQPSFSYHGALHRHIAKLIWTTPNAKGKHRPAIETKVIWM